MQLCKLYNKVLFLHSQNSILALQAEHLIKPVIEISLSLCNVGLLHQVSHLEKKSLITRTLNLRLLYF